MYKLTSLFEREGPFPVKPFCGFQSPMQAYYYSGHNNYVFVKFRLPKSVLLCPLNRGQAKTMARVRKYGSENHSIF